MGWWRTGHDDDVIGDEPADALGRALRGAAPVSVTQIVASLERALNAGAADVVEAWTGDVRLIARLRGAESEQRSEPDPAATAALEQALKEAVRTAYIDRWNRLPRLTEVAALATFVLRTGPAPDRESLESIDALPARE